MGRPVAVREGAIAQLFEPSPAWPSMAVAKVFCGNFQRADPMRRCFEVNRLGRQQIVFQHIGRDIAGIEAFRNHHFVAIRFDLAAQPTH